MVNTKTPTFDLDIFIEAEAELFAEKLRSKIKELPAVKTDSKQPMELKV